MHVRYYGKTELKRLLWLQNRIKRITCEQGDQKIEYYMVTSFLRSIYWEILLKKLYKNNLFYCFISILIFSMILLSIFNTITVIDRFSLISNNSGASPFSWASSFVVIISGTTTSSEAISCAVILIFVLVLKLYN